jgi:hypothetical protein
VIEHEYFQRLRGGKRFRAACYVFRDRRGSIRDQMNESAKRDIPGSTPPFVGSGRVMSPQSYAALAAMAAGIRQEIILPEITCFRKVAL